MSRKQHSGIFMMEMIMVVFFFILCSSVCILVFVKGDRMSRDAADLNQSVLIAQSVAEVWKLEGPEGLKQRFGASVSTQDTPLDQTAMTPSKQMVMKPLKQLAMKPPGTGT